MDHVMGGGADGLIPGHEDKEEFGNRPNGIYVPRFRNMKTKQTGFLRGYGYQGGGSAKAGRAALDCRGFGADFKNALRKPGAWHISLLRFRRVPPQSRQLLSKLIKNRTTPGAFPP